MDTLHDFIADNQSALMKSVDKFDKNTVKLNSVGCAFDPDTLFVYALNHDGNAVNYDGVHITDVTDEWLGRLSNIDTWLVTIMLKELLKEL